MCVQKEEERDRSQKRGADKVRFGTSEQKQREGAGCFFIITESQETKLNYTEKTRLGSFQIIIHFFTSMTEVDGLQ